MWFVDRYQPGDGTAYTLHIVKHEHGGFLVCCNDDSMWLAFKDGEVRHLASKNTPYGNSYTETAISNKIKELVLDA
tara:strand:- start:613 stop:840 length:228 start_codon:yes stop_codon:yes gene_type:complete